MHRPRLHNVRQRITTGDRTTATELWIERLPELTWGWDSFKFQTAKVERTEARGSDTRKASLRSRANPALEGRLCRPGLTQGKSKSCKDRVNPQLH